MIPKSVAMEGPTGESIANRNEPTPLLTVTNSDDGSCTSDVERDVGRKKAKKAPSVSKMKGKVKDLNHARGGKLDSNIESSSLQDRLFARLLQQIVPADESQAADYPVDKRSSQYVRRPAFNLALMTNNFRKFNARIGVVFVFQNQLIRLFNWTTPTHTFAFLAIYTFACLDPYLLFILPLAVVLLFIMVPGFLTRHPPPPSPSTSSAVPYYSINGPALAPPKTIKPASETSKDFFRNMRDLQNSMADYATIHDALIAVVAPLTNFSNEQLSSTVFLYLCAMTMTLFLAAHIFPWRFILFLAGTGTICSGHPTIQPRLLRMAERVRQKAEVAVATKAHTSTPNDDPSQMLQIPISRSPAALRNALETLFAISLDMAPQIREVEIFELQCRPTLWNSSQEWQPYLFTPTPYDPLSSVRISGDRPIGTRFFEDVQPPEGWTWEGKKWELDLEVREWVSERLVIGVEFEVPSEEGAVATEFGGWVWDLPAPNTDVQGKEPHLTDMDDLGNPHNRKPRNKQASGSKARQKGNKTDRDWEASSVWDGQTGAWRRRRWVRLVNRIGEGAAQNSQD